MKIIYLGLDYYSNFPNSNNPFFIRGGNYSNTTNAGVFYFNNSNGTANTNNSFRVVVPVLRCYENLKQKRFSPTKIYLRIYFRLYQRSLVPLIDSKIAFKLTL